VIPESRRRWVYAGRYNDPGGNSAGEYIDVRVRQQQWDSCWRHSTNATVDFHDHRWTDGHSERCRDCSLAATSGTIYYTLDGSTPTTSSQQYQSPFLVASNLTVNAIAVSSGSSSTVTTEALSPNIASNTLVWSEEFTSTGAPSQPNPAIWTYDTGNSGFGNNELENYCSWGSNTSPCDTTNPSEFVGANDGLPSYRGAAALVRRVHVGAVEDAGAIQLSVWEA